jgi:hypothetical protein
MNVPHFTAEASLGRAHGRHQLSATWTADELERLVPAAIKGTHCVRDDSCPTGHSKMFCKSHDPDSCEETGICCTPPPPPPPPPSCPAGQQRCTDEGIFGCCRSGTHCCNDNHGCCPNGSTCRSWFGFHFCDPIFGFSGGLLSDPSNQPLSTMARISGNVGATFPRWWGY